MPPRAFAPDLVYRGLYAGVAEAAVLAGASRQQVSLSVKNGLWLREPLGYLNPEKRSSPYWLLQDVRTDLARIDRLHGELDVPLLAFPVEDWEYGWTGQLVGVSGFARMAGIVSGVVHETARTRAVVRPADRLRMGAIWRQDEVREALEASGYPKKGRR